MDGDSLGKLKLTEMTIPGTHNSGTYDPESFFCSPGIKTQSISIAKKLSFGIRSLDLRIGQTSPGHYTLFVMTSTIPDIH